MNSNNERNERNIRILDLSRELVLNNMIAAELKNQESDILKSVEPSEYIYPNQKEDAAVITDKFYTDRNIRAISIVKKTKVGMDGLMIAIAKNMTTHPDNDFIIHYNKVFFITGMSNVTWEEEMKNKIPECFRNNVYHHGKLQYLKNRLKNIRDAVIINDEIDTGDKEDQKLHKVLRESGILDIEYMERNNIRFVFVSATMIKELRNLHRWGNKHWNYYMTINNMYISHMDFLQRGIIQESYSVNNEESALRWVNEDIIGNYGDNYRVHIIRTDEKNKRFIENACRISGILFENHTSEDRISHERLTEIFQVTNHTVIAIKGFYRRANLIPNEWKKKIGAIHEKHNKEDKFDTNVQIQGLVGRMTGYWKSFLDGGHKTGPYRMRIKAIHQYEEFYMNPMKEGTYNTNNEDVFLNPRNIPNLEAIPDQSLQPIRDLSHCRIYNNIDIVDEICRLLGYKFNIRVYKKDSREFYMTSLRLKTKVYTLDEVIEKTSSPTFLKSVNRRVCFPCYVDTNDINTLRIVILIKPGDLERFRMIIDSQTRYSQCGD